MQSWHTPFPLWSQSVFSCPILTLASWSTYRFISRQVRCSGILISLRIFCSLFWFTVKGFGIVNESEIDVFMELNFSMIQQMLAIWSLAPLPFLNTAWTSGSSWFIWCWSISSRILMIFLPECELSAVVFTLFDIAFLWDCNEKWSFTALWPLLNFQNLLAYWMQHFHSIIF